MKVHYYYPYKSDKPDKKYYIITKTEKKVYFGQASASDFIKHKNEDRKKGTFYVIRLTKIGLNLG